MTSLCDTLRLLARSSNMCRKKYLYFLSDLIYVIVLWKYLYFLSYKKITIAAVSRHFISLNSISNCLSSRTRYFPKKENQWSGLISINLFIAAKDLGCDKKNTNCHDSFGNISKVAKTALQLLLKFCNFYA